MKRKESLTLGYLPIIILTQCNDCAKFDEGITSTAQIDYIWVNWVVGEQSVIWSLTKIS